MSTQKIRQRPTSSTKIRIWLDLAFFAGMILVLAPQATGIAVHEWAGFLIVIPLLFHLILDWQWIVSITKRFFKRLQGEIRFNYLLDWLLFVLFVTASFTGVLISEAALPALGIEMPIDPFWSSLHEVSANLLTIVLGIHLAMHWQWITTNFKKFVWRTSAKRAAIQGRN